MDFFFEILWRFFRDSFEILSLEEILRGDSLKIL